MIDFNSYVERSGLYEVLKNILRKYKIDSWNPVTRTAACHYYTAVELPVSKRKTWVDNPDVRSMIETFRNGGNCVDKSIFLASLLTHVDGIETRFTKVERKPDGHVLLQTRFPGYTKPQVEDHLLSFYKKNHDFGKYRFAWEENNRDQSDWIITDPGLSRYIGDFEALQEEGFTKMKKGGWKWNHPVNTMPV